MEQVEGASKFMKRAQPRFGRQTLCLSINEPGDEVAAQKID